jgi:hypothetical protein
MEIKIIIEAIDQFELCNFKDEKGHSIKNNYSFIKLKELFLHYFCPSKDNKDFCKYCDKYLTSDYHIRKI